jgi:hypothetical protein
MTTTTTKTLIKVTPIESVHNAQEGVSVYAIKKIHPGRPGDGWGAVIVFAGGDAATGGDSMKVTETLDELAALINGE